MAKRLMLFALILVTLVTAFTVSVSAVDLPDLSVYEVAYLTNINIVQYNAIPDGYIEGTDIFASQLGGVIIPYQGGGESGETPILGYIDVPSLTYAQYEYICISFNCLTDPYSLGYEGCEVYVYRNGVFYASEYVSDFTSFIFVPATTEGDRYEITLYWREIDGSVTGDIELTLSAVGNSDGIDNVSSDGGHVPYVWLYNYGIGNNPGTDIPEIERKLPIFHNAMYIAGVRLESGDYFNLPVTPDLTYDGVYFKTAYNEIYQYLLENYPQYDHVGLSYVESVNMVIRWEYEYAFDYIATPIYITPGASLIETAYISTIDDTSYTAHAEYSPGNRPFIISTVYTPPVICDSFTLYIGNPEDYLTAFNLYSPSTVYNTGYDDGFNNGFRAGRDDGYKKGQSVGYDNGFIDGRAEGIATADSGSWRSLLSAVVDVPINAFRSLFNFEILGVNMQLAIGSLLTIVVILIIIKKLVL